MNRRRIFTGLAILLTVLYMLGFRGFLFWAGPPNSSYLLFRYAPACIVLVAIWISLGGKHGLWRLAVVCAGIVLAMHLLPRPSTTPWGLGMLMNPADGLFLCWPTTVLLYGTAAISLSLLIARGFGVKVFNVSEPQTTWVQPLQFSVAALLYWTTAVAVILAILRFAPHEANVFGQAQPIVAFRLAAMSAMCALVSMGVVWSLMGNERNAARHLGLLFGFVAMPAMTYLFVSGGNPLMWSSQTVFLSGPVFLLKKAGYRFGRLDSAIEVAESEVAAECG